MTGFPRAGERFGDFLIEADLGRGGMGVVFRATQVNLNRPVALKVLDPALAGDAEFTQRFEREASILASMSSPHVIQVFGHGRVDDCLYLATQYIAGGDLSQSLRRNGALPPALALDLTGQVLAALADAHALGVIHRDVKPSNVLLTSSGDRPFAYLADFGIAQNRESGLTRSGVVAGSWAYLAPERHAGEPAAATSDLYSAGCILWACLTGQSPYQGTDVQMAMAHASAPVPQLPGADPQTVALNRLLARSLAKEPGHRYPHATAFLNDVQATLQFLSGRSPAVDVDDRTHLRAAPAQFNPAQFNPAQFDPAQFNPSAATPAPFHPSPLPPAPTPYPSAPFTPAPVTAAPYPPPAAAYAAPNPLPGAPTRTAGVSDTVLAAGASTPSTPAAPEARRRRGLVVGAIVAGVAVIAAVGVTAAMLLNPSSGTASASSRRSPTPGATRESASAAVPVGFTCWDGSATADLAGCSLPSGVAGLEYLYPSLVADADSCAQVSEDSGYSIECSYGSDNLIRYRYWEDPAASYEHYRKSYADVEPVELALDGTPVGTLYLRDSKKKGKTVLRTSGLWLDGSTSFSVEAKSRSERRLLLDRLQVIALEDLRGHPADRAAGVSSFDITAP